jgi:hypothetical protein
MSFEQDEAVPGTDMAFRVSEGALLTFRPPAGMLAEEVEVDTDYGGALLKEGTRKITKGLIAVVAKYASKHPMCNGTDDLIVYSGPYLPGWENGSDITTRQNEALVPPREEQPLEYSCSMFHHERLSLAPGNIRVLEVLPGDGTFGSGVVQCRIRHATTDDDYTCVSYVWGPPDETHVININNQPFRVRRNIAMFLATVAYELAPADSESDFAHWPLDVRQAGKTLWIDALCIDQTSKVERNHQVQQMGQIYSSARLVIAWLGLNMGHHQLFRHICRDNIERERLIATDHWHLWEAFTRDPYWKRAWVGAV